MKEIFKKGQIVLFQGDSITDCGRNREDNTSLSEGYPGVIAKMYNLLFPENGVTFINKGISGNRVKDLVERYNEDFKSINPDFISILIGINDTWRRYDSNDPTSAEEYERNYRFLLNKIKSDMPECRIMIMEPFVLYSLPDREQWREDLNPKIQVARKLAKEYADYYLPLDGIFAKAEVEEYTCKQITEDGVHPSAIGHSIIAREYLKALAKGN
ncbi:SGNH/GDSL hydrolase family protein [Anaerocolumna sp. MB42-C2]|uniref:SGNH/GDSL hydrolase family protein n=1 Tax=Anaerocolumna sp. MB42-C2 TaxID=3070997 RepID=UPI0027E0F048|nr:SGNH/GDSL hydrolase family protein [Anaerocolumna sp. MB42-C2]WMJ88669.1 SGNH/GDSL hydrolase family protein [Anaerocolumna sp. MB42-C2]